MPDYVGNWLECRNRNCGFPIRVPCPALVWKGQRGDEDRAAAFLFACPVCLHVNPYTQNDLREVRFRSRDPYQAGRLVLYSVRFGCARPRCPTELAVLTVAAVNVSLAMMLGFWEGWRAKFKCTSGHTFRIPAPEVWWIQEEKALGFNEPS